MNTDFRIRSVPSVTNPTPRPSTPGRPGTASGLNNQQGFSSGMPVPSPSHGRGGGSFNIFDDSEDVPPAKSVFDDMVTEEYLQKAAGTQDLLTVTSLQLQVDTSYQSLLDIGDLLKRLDHLTLDASKISSVRDLGLGLKYLISLSINDCGLSELDGIGMLTSLKELSARDNDIEDVTALALHETIESIDLNGNQITDISVADTLSSCPNLHHLVLAGNSIERAPKYKLVVAAMIPQLESLDGVSVDGNAKKKVSNGMILEAASAMQLEQEELDDERRMEMEMMGDDMCFGSRANTTAAGMNGSTGIASSFSSSSGLLSEYSSGSGSGAAPGGDSSSCTLPNNGSDLTHGSAVVLAGSMASAIRRRRNGSPRASTASSSASQEDSKDHTHTESEGGREDAPMSTLATLDAAHRVVDTHTREGHEHYFEGDITKAMQKQEDKTLKLKMAASPKNSQFRQKKKKTPSSLSLDVNTSQSDSMEGSLVPPALNNPIAAAIISAAHSQNAMSFDRDDDDMAPGARKSSSGGGVVSGSSPAGWASRPLSRSHSSRGNSSNNPPSSRSPSPSARNNSSAEGRKPPKSPPIWQRNASRPQSTASSARGSTSHGGIAGGGVAPTPSAPFKVTHQDDYDHGDKTMKQKKMRNDKNDSASPCPSPLPSRTRKTSSSSSSSSASSTEVLPHLSRRGPDQGSQRRGKGKSKGKVGSLWDDSSGAEVSDSDSSDQEEEEGDSGSGLLLGRNPPPRRGVGPSGHGLQKKKGIISPNSVLVKKDNVLRGLLFADTDDEPSYSYGAQQAHIPAQSQGGGGGGIPPKREAGYSFDYKEYEGDEGAFDDDDDEEEFATDRKSRHDLMRSEQKDRDSNKHKHKQMMTFSQVSSDAPPTQQTMSVSAASTAAARSSLLSSHSQKSADTDTSDIQESSINLSECIAPSDRDRDRDRDRDNCSSISGSGKQLSEVATRSLGFDLKGSLAAINQWVDDQDSEDEDEDEEALASAAAAAAGSSKYGDVWSMRQEMKRATTAQKKILSRDKILGMCTGGDSRSRLTADNLAMNEEYNSSRVGNRGGGGGGYSYDQDDEDEGEESDCEENDVMFYDDNVDKTANSLSKSCSLLTIGGFGGDDGATKSKKKEDDEKKLMSMSLQIDKKKPPASSSSSSSSSSQPPRASRKLIKRESSKKSVADENDENEVVDSRGCTPSSSMQQEQEASSAAQSGARGRTDRSSASSSLETDVRNSPSSTDEMDRDRDRGSRRGGAEKSSSSSSRAKKMKMKIEVTKEDKDKEEEEEGGYRDKEEGGAALLLTDEQLVHMLRQPPKAVPTLKTKSGFQHFFRGVRAERMRLLLRAAYTDMADEDRDNKVNKRMELLSGVLLTN